MSDLVEAKHTGFVHWIRTDLNEPDGAFHIISTAFLAVLPSSQLFVLLAEGTTVVAFHPGTQTIGVKGVTAVGAVVDLGIQTDGAGD